MSKKTLPEPTPWENAQNEIAVASIALANAEIEVVASRRDLETAAEAFRAAGERAGKAGASLEAAKRDLMVARDRLHETRGGAS